MSDTVPYTSELAEFIVSSRPIDVSQNVRHEAKRALLHWMACSIGGCRHPSVQNTFEAFDEFSGKREATLLGRSERVDPLLAALINGISADALGFTDTHLDTIIHPGGVIGPAILPLAERNRVAGSEFLHAFLLGIEVACRVGLAVYPWHYNRGWHITGTAGVFGAAAAAGRLLGLNHQQMVWALGIAATQAAGLRDMFGSMCKSLHFGRAAQGGLFSALLARRGFTSSERAIEAPCGFAHVLGENPDLSRITLNLGKKYELARNTYKPFPCGIVVHPTVDGCIGLAIEFDLDPKTVERVEVRVNPLAVELTGRNAPVTTAEAKLSIYHSAAAALVVRQLTLREYEQDMVSRADVVALRNRIVVVPDTSIREDEANVAVTLLDKRVLRRHVDHAIGSIARPMSDTDIENKVYGLVQQEFSQEGCAKLVNACWAIEQSEDSRILSQVGAGMDTST